jgi:hypothetical protein
MLAMCPMNAITELHHRLTLQVEQDGVSSLSSITADFKHDKWAFFVRYLGPCYVQTRT